ncbi:Threonine efflux protein [Caballeronia glathei]|jgi:threonine/homoserine/homoserine lactone efflux protein|uniref:Lysine transporter LysE n=1 Tax=Caballeronia glathei TaxID=60547 RepID=A0A069PV43_9BURK|nr:MULTISPECIES: LysE family transporter [Burkholderiaceae]KDR44332.1 lysine transporter LysE [Caballeronia glathei]TCK34505.1 threonine/homoserine/homoserine lactone efflux protein [Paraburkholderia sp. BL8N3]CDY77620.1 Threonine efflux protein [Caballeronia glathei]
MHHVYIERLLALSITYSVTCVVPGPDFVNVTSHALAARKSGMLAAAGVALGCSIWSTAAAFALDFLTTGLAPFNHIIKICGASYLAYLGLRAALRALGPNAARLKTTATEAGHWASFRRGFTTDMTNPTLIVFFGSLFATILPSDAPAWVRCAAICIVTLIAGIWHLAVAMLFSAQRTLSVYMKIRRPTDIALGIVLIGLGLRLSGCLEGV